MAIINPWSLERLLQVSHQGEAISGTIEAKNDKYDIKLQTSRRPEQGDFNYLSAEINMRRARENMLSAKQVHQLASLYGGNESLRIMLNDDQSHHQFFEINIDGKKIGGDERVRTLRMATGEFSPRPLLQDICRILNLRYEERKDSFYLFQDQQPTLTPDTIRDTYQRMKKSEYFPSVSSSCAWTHKGFFMYQQPAPEGVHQTLNIYIGSQFSKDIPLSHAQISGLQNTLLEYCPLLSQLDYSWRSETAKDLEGWEGTSMSP